MEGIRHVMDTGVQVDIQRPVSNTYHMPVGIVPGISSYYLCVRLKISYMYVMTGSLLHSLTPRPSSISSCFKPPLNGSVRFQSGFANEY